MDHRTAGWRPARRSFSHRRSRGLAAALGRCLVIALLAEETAPEDDEGKNADN